MWNVAGPVWKVDAEMIVQIYRDTVVKGVWELARRSIIARAET
jgi:hypothetical protein